jgi:hypothetical protein
LRSLLDAIPRLSANCCSSGSNMVEREPLRRLAAAREGLATSFAAPFTLPMAPESSVDSWVSVTVIC